MYLEETQTVLELDWIQLACDTLRGNKTTN
jgi:hypothetical protein